ncbi:hypothetical protein [Phytoactinopolyspora limicola]|uniref:hypothetical protein n=1 Tax=Phytoactinopolyspora limicola TaxID=2715536 RepID=UPI00140E8311|nr:hypothetical protein [Phytoactinopolyspora limicola]
MTTTNGPTAPAGTTGWWNPGRFLLRRWPTALGLGGALLAAGRGYSPELLASLTEILVLLPLVYLLAVALRRRSATWPVLGGLVVVFVVLRVVGVVSPAAAFAGLALIVLVWGVVDQQLRRAGEFRVQSLGMVGFGLIALIGLVVEPDLGRYVVAAGWFLHGLWDFVHLRRDKVVVRSYAETCGVLDLLVAVLLVLPR